MQEEGEMLCPVLLCSGAEQIRAGLRVMGRHWSS